MSNYAQLHATFAPALEKIKAGSAQRELERQLPVDEIRELIELGYPKLRVPKQYGGLEHSLDDVVELLIDIAAADANIAQALRGHFAFVELLLEAPESEFKSHWLAEIATGKLFGNAESEKGGAYGAPQTFIDEITQDGEKKYILNGTKYYTTGTYYADYTWTTALWRQEDGTEVLVSLPVDLSAPGVEVIDDWDGFGQRLTASGTTKYTEVSVDKRWLVPLKGEPSLVWPVLQLNLLAVLVGSADAAVRDIADRVRNSSRNAWNPDVEHKSDPAATDALGDGRARVSVLRGALVDAARRVEYAAGIATPEAFNTAELAVTSLWAITTEQAQLVTSRVFDAVGASATLKDRALDRHWRNVRTVSSNNPVYQAKSAVGQYEIDGTPVGTYIGKALEQRPSK